LTPWELHLSLLTRRACKFFGIWGDENGDDGDLPMVGETSISMATLCFGKSMTGDNGYSETDVLYLAFTGPDAVPGPEGAAWNAKDPVAFEQSISGLGNKLLGRLGSGGNTGDGGGNGGSGNGGSGDCSWSGHCEGESVSQGGDAAGSTNSTAAAPSPASRLTFGSLQGLVVSILTAALMT
jgi:hypothetical protein